jgi:hypothetical protein
MDVPRQSRSPDVVSSHEADETISFKRSEDYIRYIPGNFILCQDARVHHGAHNVSPLPIDKDDAFVASIVGIRSKLSFQRKPAQGHLS